jgi:O-antigen ligase
VTREAGHALRNAAADGALVSSVRELAAGRRPGRGWRQSGWLAVAAAVAGVLAGAWMALYHGSPLLAFAPVAAVVGLVVMVLDRRAAAYVMLASLPFAEISVGSGVSLVRYILIGAIGLWLIGAIVFEPFAWLRFDPTDIKVLLWALASVASAAILNTQAAPGLAQTYLNLALVYYVASRVVRNPQQARGAVLALTIGLGLVAALSLALPSLAGSFDVGGLVRQGPLGASGAAGINRFAGWLAVGVVLPWLALDGPRRASTVLARTLSVVIFAAMLAAVSKAAIAAVGVGLLSWAVLSPWGSRVARGAMVLVILSAGWFLLPTGLHERFAAFNQPGSVAFSRFAIWEGGLKMFIAHPWFGVGVGNYDQFAPAYFPPGTGYQAGQESHSIVIGALAETGIAGSLILAVMIGTIMLEGIRLLHIDGRQSGPGLEDGSASRPACHTAFARASTGLLISYLVFLTVSLSVDLQRDRFFVALAGLVHGVYKARSRAVT